MTLTPDQAERLYQAVERLHTTREALTNSDESNRVVAATNFYEAIERGDSALTHIDWEINAQARGEEAKARFEEEAEEIVQEHADERRTEVQA